jgi:hypothetical protein
MGATTLYHPISLLVIRGAADYCGWKLAKIQQKHSDFEHCSAVYQVEIIKMPKGMDEMPLAAITRQFQHCFMDDIQVTHLYRTPRGNWYARLSVHVHAVQHSLNELAIELDDIKP